MSQYPDNIPADRSFPLTQAYFDKSNAGSSSGLSMIPAVNGSNNWPPYYAHGYLTPSSTTIESYITTAGSSASASVDPNSWQVATNQSTFTAAGATTSYTFAQYSSNLLPQSDLPLTQSFRIHDYPTSSQRTVLSTPPPPTDQQSFHLSSSFTEDRHQSPSSQGSASDHGASREGWNSPGLDELELNYHYPQSIVTASDNFAEKAAESGHPSEPESTVIASSSSHARVKDEPDDTDGRFIMELSAFPPLNSDLLGRSSSSLAGAYKNCLALNALSPPTEVPLRATQASIEMRQMMGVFRLNPFAMHSLSVNAPEKVSANGSTGEGTQGQPPWCGGVPGPLEEEPLMFEFQLDISDDVDGDENASFSIFDATRSRIQGLGLEEEAQLRSFSPSFQLHEDDEYGVGFGHRVETARVDASNRDTQLKVEERDHDPNPQQNMEQHHESWDDVDRSEVESTSTTTRSIQTPFHDSPSDLRAHTQSEYEHAHIQPQVVSTWNLVHGQYHGLEESQVCVLPTTLQIAPKMAMECGLAEMRVPRLHSTNSHPYLRKTHQNSPAARSHSLSYPVVDHSPYVHPPEHLQNAHTSYQQPQHPFSHHYAQSLPFLNSQQYQPQKDDAPLYQNQSLVPNPIIRPLTNSSYMRIETQFRNEQTTYQHPQATGNNRSAGVVGNDVDELGLCSLKTTPVVPNATYGTLLNAYRRWSLPETGFSMTSASIPNGTSH